MKNITSGVMMERIPKTVPIISPVVNFEGILLERSKLSVRYCIVRK
jgi:hypothetical protein